MLLTAGCATTSTVETRKQERYNAYSELSPEQRTAVDAGQIKVGMSMDAVYIAWGSPSQILAGESSQGASVTWIYHGTYFEEHQFWGYPYYGHYGYCRRYYYPGPYLAYDYSPRTYVRAEVRFVGGIVKEWRSLPLHR